MPVATAVTHFSVSFLSLMHTRAKLGIAFWDYLGDRIGIDQHARVPALANLIRCRGQPA